MKNVFTKCGKPVSREDIAAAEEALRYSFPESFVSHYLQFNGGVPEFAWFVCPGGYEPLEVAAFMPIKYSESDRDNPGSLLEGLYHIMRERNVIPEELLPFANDWGGNFCLNMRDNRIYFYATDSFDGSLTMEENHQKLRRCISESFGYFLDGLVSEQKAMQSALR